MAIYHLSTSVVQRSAGRSSVAAAAYRSGTRLEDLRSGQIHDYTRKKGVTHTEIFVPEGAPEWAKDRAELWNEVEAEEKRKDAQLAREMNVAIPVELVGDQRVELVRRFARSLADQGMVVDLAVHEDNPENPHVHLLLTMRSIGPDGFGKKNRRWNDRKVLQDWRERWAMMANDALQSAQVDERIDHRTLKAQGIKREPTIHMGPTVTAMDRRGIETPLARAAKARAAVVEAQKRVLRDARILYRYKLLKAQWQSAYDEARLERDHQLMMSVRAYTDRRADITRAVERIEDAWTTEELLRIRKAEGQRRFSLAEMLYGYRLRRWKKKLEKLDRELEPIKAALKEYEAGRDADSRAYAEAQAREKLGPEQMQELEMLAQTLEPYWTHGEALEQAEQERKKQEALERERRAVEAVRRTEEEKTRKHLEWCRVIAAPIVAGIRRVTGRDPDVVAGVSLQRGRDVEGIIALVDMTRFAVVQVTASMKVWVWELGKVRRVPSVGEPVRYYRRDDGQISELKVRRDRGLDRDW